MKVFVCAAQQERCDHCVGPVPEGAAGDPQLARDHPARKGERRVFCSLAHHEAFEEPRFRCPDCVMQSVDPCPHQDKRGPGDGSQDRADGMVLT